MFKEKIETNKMLRKTLRSIGIAILIMALVTSITGCNTNNHAGSEAATLSGIWKLNDKLTVPDVSLGARLDATINFFSNGQNFHYIAASKTLCLVNNSPYYGSYFTELEYDDDADSTTATYYHDLYGWDTDYQIVDFGSTPQEVSQDFYRWFIQNAAKWSVENNTQAQYSLSGTWQFNDTITPYNPSKGNILSMSSESIRQNIHFISNGKTYTRMIVYSYNEFLVIWGKEKYTTIMQYSEGGTPNAVYYKKREPDGIGWGSTYFWHNENPSYKIVDFGTIQQPVSADFYNWFTQNATPV